MNVPFANLADLTARYRVPQGGVTTYAANDRRSENVTAWMDRRRCGVMPTGDDIEVPVHGSCLSFHPHQHVIQNHGSVDLGHDERKYSAEPRS
jgi:hypothetical protein